MTVYAGTIGWSYNFWKGPFYPTKLPSSQFLSYYSTQFNTVEVDNTFYRMPNQQKMLNWKQQTPEDFMFSLKFPRLITHVKLLRDCKKETAVFLERAQLLDKKLGPMLLQLPPGFGEEHFSDLAAYLNGLPKGLRFAVEIRNQTLMNEQLFGLLKDNRIALVWTDNPIMPQNPPLTSDFVYLRLEGDRSKINGILGKVEVDRSVDVKAWAEKLAPLKNRGIVVFGYFGKFFSGFPTVDVRHFMENMGGIGYQKTLM
jgi:uncharacterized protein YecE (DUF72 family)